ncbi:MAG: ImmA/IrrE family metallo-endopeptidase [Eubacteriales bacterium]|nr:ImmA/IrrE family metallo-endopeptidase [Eubacteriales bacterium]
MLTILRAEEIQRRAAELAKEHGTADPELLAERMGIMLDYAEHPHLLGFCGVMLGVPFIALNSRTDDDTLRCACAHELGHLALEHPLDGELRVIRSTELANMEATMEAEANCFAAALLAGDEEAIEAIREYGDARAAAAELRICPELFAAKVRLLQLKGYPVQTPELSAGAWHERT